MSEKLIELHVEGLDDGVLRVREAQGSEEISGLYRFELEIFSKKTRIKPSDVLQAKAWLGIREMIPVGGKAKNSPIAKIHGIITSFEQQDKLDEWVRYRAVLSPTLWKLTLARHSRVFLNNSVKTLIDKVFQPLGVSPKTALSGTYPEREHTMQYEESDFHFLSRWTEQEGILYFFDHTSSGEEVKFADNSSAHKPIEGEAAVEYRSTPSGSLPVGVVGSLSSRSKVLPKEVVLADWDHKTVSEVPASAPVDNNGFGKVHEYGIHPQSAAHATALAKARAEAIKSRGQVLSGTSSCRFFRSGFTFKLKNHYAFDGEYLLTRVTHRMSQPLGIPHLKDEGETYANDFECVPASETYRPERRTPWPRIHGFLDGTVTGKKDDGGKPAPGVDPDGGYTIRMHFDKPEGGAAPAEVPAVRMAQPYAGESRGMHFPLPAQTEVLIGHKNGDPDRPVILSAVPNPKTASPVAEQNSTQCVIRSASNNVLRLEDKKDAEDFFIHASKDKNTRVVNDELTLVERDQHTKIKRDRIEDVDGGHHEHIGKNYVSQVDGNYDLDIGKGQVISIGSDGLCLVVDGPIVQACKDHTHAASGNYYLKATGIVIEATSGITIVCGQSALVIDSAGVTLSGPVVTIDGKQTKINSGPGSSPQSGKAGSDSKPDKPKAAKEASQC
jgi:type VI secretion system secreted protein VgrG